MRFPFEILGILAVAILAAIFGLWPVTGAALLIALPLGAVPRRQVGLLASPRAAPAPRPPSPAGGCSPAAPGPRARHRIRAVASLDPPGPTAEKDRWAR